MSDPSTVSDTGTAPAVHTRAHPFLVLAFESDRPHLPSIRFSLDGVDEVRVGRGERRGGERVGASGRTHLEVRVPDGRISSSHARLVRDLDRWVVEDAGSKNGVLVNGVRQERALLGPGDLLELGHTFFLYAERPVPPGPVPVSLSASELRPLAPGLETFVPELDAALASLAQVATSPVPIVLQGETGTGKEITAHAVHALSRRAGALVPINCGALPETLVESELFGHRKGAFTGATSDRPGLVRSAAGGTLFLDEIGDLPMALQAAFLRVLQEGEVLPLGAPHPVKVDLRVVAATHRDLQALVDFGTFRSDLFARLSGYTLRLPPLRERREDLGLLVGALLRRLAPDPAAVSFSGEAARALLAHGWPLNIRELEKALAVSLALAGNGRIERAHLPELLRDARPSAPAPQPAPELGEAELARRAHLLELLGRHRGNVSAVARELGVARMQVQRWMKRYALDASRFRGA